MSVELKLAAKELSRRKSKPKATFNLKDYLFDKQLAFVEDSDPFKVAVTTRRAGKTVSCAADLVYTAINHFEVICLYVTLSRSNAKRIVWPELKRINRLFGLGGEFNESELAVRFPNGSIVYCSGASDRSEIDKFRGLALKRVYIDECQAFPQYIEELIDDVLAPALMDYAGSLCLIGTPGPIPSGYFYNCSRSDNWKCYTWSFWDNPFIASKSGLTHQEVFDRELKRRGVALTDPSIQREWFGKWVLDSDSLVYHYDAKKNDYKELPKLTHFLLGVDLGYDDADALAVLGYSDSSPNTYLVEEQITRHQDITSLVEQIDHFKKKYDISNIIIDTAGLGKKIGEEVSKRWGIAIEPAEKARKLEYIELMNDALRTGKLKARLSSRFAEDCTKVEWDKDKSRPDKKKVSDRFHSDICDAVLYAWRCSYSFTHIPEIIAPKYGTRAWQEAEEDRMWQDEVDKANKEKDMINNNIWGDSWDK